MYRVLIVDDEPWVAYGLSKLINWEELGFTVVGEAHDGLTAIALIEQNAPDVVVSDIRMPGLDGIELLEEIRKRGLDTSVIFVSGYSEFQYAQQALKLGAFDYLLKQVERGALQDTMSRLKEMLDDKRRLRAEPDSFLNDLFDLLDPDSKMTIGAFLAGKGYRFEHPHYRFISCQFPYATVTNIDQLSVTVEGIEYLSFRTGPNQTTLLVNYDESGAPITILDFITLHLSDALHIGISSRFCSSDSLSKSYQEADIALFSSLCSPDSRAVSYKDRTPAPELTGDILQLELAVKEQRATRAKDLLEAIGHSCCRQDLLIDQVTGIYNQLVSLIHKYYGSGNVTQNIEYLTYDHVARHYGSYPKLFRSLEEVFESQADMEIVLSNDQVKEIMAYIDSRYSEDLILGDVAKHFSMSVGYLSSLIKKKTGTGYSEYITGKRLQRAKELLAEPRLSVQEIVQQVGYKDYFYFNKLFKKHVGVTPSKFRKI
ncbi:two-component system response regulator YesN [Paenibacillus phyllosphaerae]|uniref:Two-component system response regulator YesN n=1 Tax=Paenibacillus phyllosphaerae TaxID=274593 RepID=A0A7W5B3P6_9BACL|nr:response regulator [Paenibacillus phyllosphaerae]MBB3113121.1 two-component system response regulator YesN [Paenibacillus phyllosphaerae]